MSILQIVDSLSVGGSESLAASLACSFIKKGVNNLICGTGRDGPLRERLDVAGVQAIHLDRPIGISPSVMIRVGELIIRNRCDAILTHHFRQLVHAVPASAILRRRLVHVEHDTHSYQDRPDLSRWFARLAPYVYKFVCISQEIMDWFAERIPEISHKLLPIPNGVDTNLFRRELQSRASIRTELGIPPDAFVVGTCARLERVKDLGLLIRGFRHLRKLKLPDFRSVHLVIVGSGSLMNELQTIAHEEGVGDCCTFAGGVNDVPRWLNGFDVYAITSLEEGLPLSVLEAMSCELPVISVRVGSLPSLIDKDVGYILDSRSPEELGLRLAEYVHEPTLRQRLGQAARKRVESAFSLDGMVNEYLRALVAVR